MPAARPSDWATRSWRKSRLIVDAYRHATDFQYITCSDIQASTECKDFYSSLRNYFLEHSGFRDSVEKFGRNYHRHNWEKLVKNSRGIASTFPRDIFSKSFPYSPA